ncbi:MAG: hypothetical protein QOF89_5058 [Acidobacteriota bacterium]|jgi:hypothetical protein|nr:hypothetical protein [Acidobacteriota bacterium]
MKNFFLFCSGANLSVLAECPSDVTKYTGIGATIFFTAILAGISGGYALFTVFRSLWVAFPAALLWGLMIFNLDRVIITGMRKQKDFRRDLFYAMPRFLLATLLAVVISKPLELKLFEREIRAQITHSNNEKFHNTIRTIDAAFSGLRDLEAQNQTLRQEIEAKQKAQDKLAEESIQEAEGTAGTRLRGKGPVFREKQQRMEEVQRQVEQVESRNTALIKRNDQEIARLQEERKRRIEQETQEQEAANGFLAQIEALSRLNASNWGARLASWFITLLFIVIEISPVAVKLLSTLSPYRPYDQKLEDLELEIVESSEQFRQVLRQKLNTATQQEVADLKATIATEATIRSNMDQQRIEVEREANELLMRRIAEAQREIAERIVEKWKSQELEKVEYDVTDYINVS